MRLPLDGLRRRRRDAELMLDDDGDRVRRRQGLLRRQRNVKSARVSAEGQRDGGRVYPLADRRGQPRVGIGNGQVTGVVVIDCTAEGDPAVDA
jgi:hypothetical protein